MSYQLTCMDCPSAIQYKTEGTDSTVVVECTHVLYATWICMGDYNIIHVPVAVCVMLHRHRCHTIRYVQNFASYRSASQCSYDMHEI